MHSPSEPISPVESHLSYWLNYVGYRLFYELRRQTLQLGVTAAESVVLRKLHAYRSGEMPSVVAWHLGLSCGYLSRLSRRLEIKGLIHRDKSPLDRRSLTLTLTAAGRALVNRLASLADHTNARHFGATADAPLGTIESMMKRIVQRNLFRFVPADRCRVLRDPIYLYGLV